MSTNDLEELNALHNHLRISVIKLIVKSQSEPIVIQKRPSLEPRPWTFLVRRFVIELIDASGCGNICEIISLAYECSKRFYAARS